MEPRNKRRPLLYHNRENPKGGADGEGNYEAELVLLHWCIDYGGIPPAMADCPAEIFWGCEHHELYQLFQRVEQAGLYLDHTAILEHIHKHNGHIPAANMHLMWEHLLHARDDPTRFGFRENALKIAIERYKERELACLGDVYLGALRNGEDPDEVIARIKAKLSRLEHAGGNGGTRKLSHVVSGMRDTLEGGEAYVQIIPTNISPRFDEALLGGVGRGEVLVIGGYPGTGKSSLTCLILDHAAHGGLCNFIASYEMGDTALAAKIMTSRLNAQGTYSNGGERMNTSYLSRPLPGGPDPLPPIIEYQSMVPEEISDRIEIYQPRIRHTYEDMFAAAENWAESIPVGKRGFVIIDHLLSPKGLPRMGDTEKVGAIMAAAMTLARTTRCAVICISHIKRPDGSPLPRTVAELQAQFAQSSNIERIADMLMLGVRMEHMDPIAAVTQPDVLQFYPAKMRDGALAKRPVKLVFKPGIMFCRDI